MARVRDRKPDWVRFRIPGGETYTRVKKTIKENNLHTVCLEAGCPNIGECFGCGTATFMILGSICTRNCRYCAVTQGIPVPPDLNEPERVAEAVKRLDLRYAVITSVTRDDCPDGGASVFCDTIKAIRRIHPSCKIEVLIPDFGASMMQSLEAVIDAGPDVINHNIEVAANYYHSLRPAGNYGQSIKIINTVASSGLPAKSGLMIGFGETIDDIRSTLYDLYLNGCSLLTVGQYLQSKKTGFPVVKYYTPEEFDIIAAMAREMGFLHVMSGPQVRSSYHAGNMV